VHNICWNADFKMLQGRHAQAEPSSHSQSNATWADLNLGDPISFVNCADQNKKWSNYIMAISWLYPAIPMSDMSAKPMNFKVSTLILGHPLDIGPWTTAEGKTTRAALENYWLAIVWAAVGNVWIVQQCRIWVRFHQSLKIIKNLNVSATSKQIA